MFLYGVLPLLSLLYVQQSASQLINRDEGIIFDFHGKKRLFPSKDTFNVKNKSVAVQDQMDCIFECSNVSWCRSMNFQTTPLASGLHFCELLSLDHLNNTKYQLNDSNVFHHYSIKVIYTHFSTPEITTLIISNYFLFQSISIFSYDLIYQ